MQTKWPLQLYTVIPHDCGANVNIQYWDQTAGPAGYPEACFTRKTRFTAGMGTKQEN